MVALIMILAAVAKLGFVASLISKPTMIEYPNGANAKTFRDEVRKLAGRDPPRDTQIPDPPVERYSATRGEPPPRRNQPVPQSTANRLRPRISRSVQAGTPDHDLKAWLKQSSADLKQRHARPGAQRQFLVTRDRYNLLGDRFNKIGKAERNYVSNKDLAASPWTVRPASAARRRRVCFTLAG
jgi:hypothetical protein